MQRPIKFRAWDKVQNRFIKTLAIRHDGTLKVERFDGSLTRADKAERFDIQLYTSLKDKNGVEIYEGDIVRSLEGDYVVRWFDYDEIDFEISGTSTNYPERAPAVGFGFEPIENDNWMGFDHKDFKLCYFQERTEVIGNIMENPEFLK